MGCGHNRTLCEDQVDAFLNNYCNNVAANPYPSNAPSQCSTTNDVNTITVSPTCSQASTLTITQCRAATLTTTVNPSCTQSQHPVVGLTYRPTSLVTPMESPPPSSSSLESSEKSTQTINTVIVLGLLGLSVVLLAVVTTGWVCTCLIMKKRKNPAQNRYMYNISCLYPTYDRDQSITSECNMHGIELWLGQCHDVVLW